MPQQRDTPPERKHMALIRRASTTLRRALATYAKVAVSYTHLTLPTTPYV